VGKGAAGQESIVVGLTVSHTGNLTAESTNQFNGLTLWAEQVNEDGGIGVGDDSVTVELGLPDEVGEREEIQRAFLGM
jgi:ABC-type branched-subunit amino acid transport system substrate-binding protein